MSTAMTKRFVFRLMLILFGAVFVIPVIFDWAGAGNALGKSLWRSFKEGRVVVE
jgi:hypothetical protein